MPVVLALIIPALVVAVTVGLLASRWPTTVEAPAIDRESWRPSCLATRRSPGSSNGASTRAG